MYLSRVYIIFKSLEGNALATGIYHVATSGKTKAEIVAAALKASRKHDLMDDRVSNEVIRVAEIQFVANADNPKALAEKLAEFDDTNPEMLFDMVHDAANVIAARVNEGGLHGQLTFIRSVQKDYAALLADILDQEES